MYVFACVCAYVYVRLLMPMPMPSVCLQLSSQALDSMLCLLYADNLLIGLQFFVIFIIICVHMRHKFVPLVLP